MVVDGQAQLIRNDPASGSTAAKRLDDIETSTRRLKCKAERLRSGLLLLSESDESWTPVSEAIVTAQRQLAPMTGSLQVDVHGEETLELLCPSDVLVSICRELLANASDARRPGDNIAYAKVQIERGPLGPIIVVTDSGQLSLPEVLNRATLPFIAYPSLPSKAGFGLALVKTLVEAVSGSLALTETAQGGCKVTICWPEERTRRSQALDLDS